MPVHKIIKQVRGIQNQLGERSFLGYRKFKAAGYSVFVVNPHLTTFDGHRLPTHQQPWL